MADNLQMARQGTSFYDAVAGQDSSQTVTISNSTGGTFTLTFDGQTTAAIAYNASAAAVQSALEALSSIGVGNVSVTGSNGGPYTVTFIGDFARTNVSTMTASGTSLVGAGHAVAVAVLTTGIDGISLAWGTGTGAVREIVYLPPAARSVRVLAEIANGNIVETASAVTTKPAVPYGYTTVRLSRHFAGPPTTGDTLTYDSGTGLWTPEVGK